MTISKSADLGRRRRSRSSALLWRKGYLLRLTNYVQETREELRKCTWPTWDELKGSTVVVMISIVAAGRLHRVVDHGFRCSCCSCSS